MNPEVDARLMGDSARWKALRWASNVWKAFQLGSRAGDDGSENGGDV